MLLRRISQHVKDQNWFAVFLDFMIVVLGVFMGLQVQNWANEQGRRQLELNYTERLHTEVMELQKRRTPLLAAREIWDDGLLTVTPLLFDETDREITAAECRAIAMSYVVTNPTDSLASLTELQESGQLSFFRNSRLSLALREFLLIRSRAHDSGVGIAKNNANLLRSHADLIKTVKPMVRTLSPDAVLSREPGVYICDLEAMRLDSSFLNDFQVTQSGYGTHMRNNLQVTNSLIKIHRELDAALGLTHEAMQ